MHAALNWWVAPAALAAAVGILRLHHVRWAYEEHFRESRHERLFLAWTGFILTVAVVRLLTWAIHNSIGRFS